MAKVFSFLSLPTTELVIDAVYEGGTKGNAADDVLGNSFPARAIKAASALSAAGMRHA
jgi:hypothetical protein